MLSDSPALDLSDDACSIVCLFFLNSCQWDLPLFSVLAISVSYSGGTVLTITALTS